MSIFGIENGILCQQVNCQNVIGAGLSGEIIKHFPVVKENYHKSFEGKQKGDLYGKYNVIKVDDNFYIANLYTQFFYGNAAKTGKVYTDEQKLLNAISEIASKNPDKEIYVPEKIGCGLAGGDWKAIVYYLNRLPYDNLNIVNTFTHQIEHLSKKENDHELI